MTVAQTPKLDSQTDLIHWEQIDPQTQQKIENAIASSHPPNYLIIPPTEEALSQVMKAANEDQVRILSCGYGTKLNWGGLVKSPQWVVSTRHLNRIIEHAIGDLTVTVEAGVKLTDLQDTLKPYKQFLPIDPAYPDSATIGGMVATADAGNWRQRYGGIKDMVLGLSFVRADGKIAKGGGRVVKNVAGYDMMKLFTGSYGTLGIISQVTLRLYPLQEASKSLVILGESKNIATLTQTLQMSSLTPIAADVISSGVVTMLGIGEAMGLMLRFQGIPESVEEQSNQVAILAQKLGLEVNFYQGNEEDHLWKRLQETLNITSTETAVTGKIGIMPHQIVNFLQQLEKLTTKSGLGMINIGSGLGKLQLDGEGVLSQLNKLRSLLETEQGFLTVLEAPKAIKNQFEPWGYNGNALDMMGKIKQKFDPNNILSPGRFVGGI